MRRENTIISQNNTQIPKNMTLYQTKGKQSEGKPGEQHIKL